MIRFYTNYFISTSRHIQFERFIKSLMFVCIMIGAPSAAISQSVETWKLVKKEYPVLPAVRMKMTKGRNAGSFVKMRRTQMINKLFTPLSLLHTGLPYAPG